MAGIPKNNIRFPVKIGDESRVATYSATLLNGEEQLLVTRDGRFYLTDGNGGFTPFKTNSSYTTQEVDSKINILNQTDTDIKNDIISFKQTVNDSISILDNQATIHETDINNIKIDINNINTSDIPASRITVDVPILGIIQQISLQEVISNILVSVGGYVMPAETGESECGTTECGA